VLNFFESEKLRLELYYPYSKYLKDKYGEKVYKLPINVPGTCPNRDGLLGDSGCAYCAKAGAGFESLDSKIPIKTQILKNKDYIGKRYGAKKFIPYFQNYSGTYMKADKLKENLKQAIMPDIVGINISTRPDCISDEIADILKKLSKEFAIDICVEIGLQTANYHTLKKINRGHDLAQFVDAVIRLKTADISVSAHVIIDFPDDNLDDVIETSKVLSALKVDGVKIHSLYIARESEFGELYKAGKLSLIGEEAYIMRAISFLEHLSPEIYVERLLGRIPKKDSLTANFNRSWWAIKEEIEKKMMQEKTYQGAKFDYLNGSANRAKFGD
jgi:uncharacterized protein